MRRLVLVAVSAAAAFAFSAPASAEPQCPPILCDLLDQCYDTGEIRFCL